MRISAVLAAALLTTGALAAAERAQASIRHYQLDIPRQSLDSAIKDLAQQTGLQIARFSDTIDGDILVGPVKGNRTPEEALGTLLTRDMRYKVVNDTTIAIIDAKDDRSGGLATRIIDSSGTSPLPGSTKAPHMLLASDAEPVSASAPSGGGAAEVGEQSDRDAHGTAPLSEIVVTANKLNTQRVLDIPTSIQAISGDALHGAGKSAFMDIAGQIPGLSVQDLGPGDKKYVIRGINSTGDSTAGIYYGEAVISGSNANDGGGFQSDIRLYDLDHVEVLRGPQGTLYGASSMSGTIRFIPKSPEFNAGAGYLSVEGSSTSHGSGNFNLNGALNLPLIDDMLAMRVVGWRTRDSGYVDQIRVGKLATLRDVNNDDVDGGRVMLRYRPIENLTIDLNYTGQSETSNGSSRYTPAGITSWSGPGIPPVQGCDLCNTDVTVSPWRDDLQVYGLTVNYKAGFGTFTATSNQYNRDVDFNFDSTPILVSFGVPVPAESVEPQSRRVSSSELRFASDFDSPVNFVVGGFRQYESTHWLSDAITTNDLGQVDGPFSESNSDDAYSHPGVGHTFFGQTDHRTTQQYAGFGEATWKATSKLTFIGGLRYFTERLEGVQVSTHPFGGFPPGAAVGPVYDPTQTYNKVTYKANASYKLNDALLTYVTVSSGFRGGGLNAQSEPFEPIPKSFAPDSLTNYEFGGKGQLFDRRLDYQVDAYLIHWNNIQVSETTSDGAFPYVGNAGKAEVKGVEFELAMHPFEYFTTSFAGSYQDARLTEGATAAMKIVNPTLGLTGENIPNVPKTQFSLGLDYTRPFTTEWKVRMAADVNYRGSVDSYFASNQFNIPLASYTLVNLRLAVLNDQWTVTAFARNLTDKRAQVSAINSSQDPSGFLTVRPRTVGLTIERRF
ncbi:MAG TPA: TonB-dependent receptor [Steroidobacteraceae bacterium]|nr:TonB-dependent receptor [Steroidobacteraceae bacterium]